MTLDSPDRPASHPGRTPTRRKWLCIAYAFPPINRSGTHRTLGFVRHLHSLGWDATVITVRPTDEPLDDALQKQVPAATRIIRTAWIDPVRAIRSCLPWTPRASAPRGILANNATPPRDTCAQDRLRPLRRIGRLLTDFVTRALRIPDSRIGWIPFAVWAGWRQVGRCRPDVLYSTSPYASAHLAALILSRWFGLPWVADFRDPWSGNPFRESANPWLSRWDAFLERMVLRFAGHIVCNTPTAAAKMIQRYAWVSAKCTTILNGFDFEALTGIEPIRTAPPDQFVFTHCGQFYGRRDPSIWFQALGRIRADAPHIANRIRFVSIGRPDYDGTPLSAIAAKYGVADLLECPGSHSHAETIGRMLGSDALILAGSSGDGSELQIPNKLFEYLAAQRPIIATACPQNPIREVLAQAKADHVVCDPLDVAGLAAAIASISKPGRPIASTAWTGFSQFSRRQCALELSTLFERLARVRKDSKAQATKAGRSHSGPIKSAHIETPSSRPWNFAAAQPN